jgi:ubiquinone/menaquinone biosynthesis C-methylase UbiE
MSETMPSESILRAMREDWDRRACNNAEFYVQSAKSSWDERDFFRSGEISVANEIMTDMSRITGGSRSPLDLDVLEIGCGVGRMTRMMARIFHHVTGVDVSAEMIQRAKTNLSTLDNVTLIVGDGASLSTLKDATFDFAFSFIVFQHIPNSKVITSYCREVYRVLRPGALFKFQVQGTVYERHQPPDTWQGVTFSEENARQLCAESGFLLELSRGAGTQFYWLWFRKPYG